jgi:hypothetical protein
MSQHGTEPASAEQPASEDTDWLFAQQDGKLLIAEGATLLPLPLAVQLAGDLIARIDWGVELLLLAQLVLFFGGLYFWGQHRSDAWRRSPWSQDLAVLLVGFLGALPLAMMLVVVMGGPDIDGVSFRSAFSRMGGFWLPVLSVVLIGGMALVAPRMRHGHHVLFWSMVVLAWTYLAVPIAWRYGAANAGCCLVMIGAGWALLRQSRSRVATPGDDLEHDRSTV